MNFYRIILFVISLFNIGLFAEENSNFSLSIDNEFKIKNLLGSIVYLEDKNKIYDLTKINQSLKENYSQWNKTGEDELSFGFTNSVYWIHFSIKNKSDIIEKVFLECNLATMDKIEIFYSDFKDEKFTKKLSGDMYPFKNREVKFRTNVFSIPLKPGEEKKIFLRLENKGPMKFSLLLRSPEEFSVHIISDQVILGIYYGVMIVIFLYNLFLYFSIREATYLYYINYVLHVAVYQFVISGNAAQFLFSNSPDIANRAPNVIANLSFITALLFTKSFLNTNFYSKTLNKIIIGLISISCILIAIILIVGHEMILMKTSNLLGLAMIFTIITSAIQVYRAGYRPARFFLFGWSFLLMTVFIQILANLGTFNITAEHIGQIGSATEVVLLSFALADKMKIKTSISQEPKVELQVEIKEESPKKEAVKRPIFTILQKEYGLTYQQAQVCTSLIDGKSRVLIANELGISINTLKKHLSEIYNKTINKIENSEIPSQEKLQKLTVFLHSLKPKD